MSSDINYNYSEEDLENQYNKEYNKEYDEEESELEDCEEECDNNYESAIIIPINKDNFIDEETDTLKIEYDISEFQRGIDEYSYISGAITALINIGVPPELALNYIMNKEGIEQNVEIASINSETNISVAEKQGMNIEKNTL